MNIEELAAILKDNYANADKGNKVSAVHAFGIQYANEIKENNYTASEIIKKSGLNKSYSTELSKGIKLYESMKNDKEKNINKNVFNNKKDFPLNQILYGPPGTGKTYFLSKIKNQIMKYNKDIFLKKQSVKQNITGLTWSEVIALGMYKAGKNRSYKPNELYKLNFINEYIVNKKENGGSTPECSLRSDLMRNSVKNEAISESGKTGNDYFEYDATQKSYRLSQNGVELVETVLDKYIKEFDKKEINEDDFCKSITFHQSYSYEDFIIGIRPDTDCNEGLSFKEKRGVFKVICDDALNNPEYKYLITIDEINRGNISKIFGELITLIETNKRWGNDEQQKLTLPTGGTFCVPNNLYIVGTMNTADKSLALLDIALRRRFEFIPKYPVYDIDGIYYTEFLKKLNKEILVRKKKADYLIGHAYFMDKQKQPALKDILNKKVIPLLMEYFNGDKDCVAEILKNADSSLTFADTFHLEVI